MESALEDQRSIGWGHAVHGFLSQEWSNLACQDMLMINRQEPDAGLRRMRTIIAAIYKHSTRIWLARNVVLHSNEDIVNRDIRSAEIAEIKALATHKASPSSSWGPSLLQKILGCSIIIRSGIDTAKVATTSQAI